MWDVFISHAWEDKKDIARPLAEAMRREGLRVWYDEFTLRVGDSLRRSIDHGLAKSRYGVVVLSPDFFAKEWPQKELDGLAAREVSGKKVILPVWYNISADQIREYSPTLADRVAVLSDRGLEHVVGELLRVIKPTSEPVRLPGRVPPQGPSAKPRQPVINWRHVGALAVVMGMFITVILCIALGSWLVPNLTDLLSAWLSKTPTVTPTSSPTHMPVIPTAPPSLTPTLLTPTPVLQTPTGTQTETPTLTLTPTPTPKPVAMVQAEVLNVRGGPGTEYDVVGKVKQGDELNIAARTEGGDWLQVRLSDGKKGWISAQLVEISGDVAGIPVAFVIPPIPMLTPTDIPILTPMPTAVISFSVDNPNINFNECTYLRWHIGNIREAYLDGEGVGGPDGSKEICPREDKVYTLRVIHLNGTEEVHQQIVNVSLPPFTSVPPTFTPTLVPPSPSPVIIDPMDSTLGWSTYKDADPTESSISIRAISGGKINSAIEISWNLKRNGWVGISKRVSPEVLSKTGGIKLFYRGDGNPNTIELKLVYGDERGTTFGVKAHGATVTDDWKVFEARFSTFECWWQEDDCKYYNYELDINRLDKLDFVISNKPEAGDTPGSGTVVVDHIHW